ncbi:hypothetical protein EYR40_009264 [Pleurotus pulmonarius]|nr:hypothetical protein EYR36_005363 [Pleurotus pulmonarius]KAF4590341.1 hypothetical protein EYR38_009640 [Pleurotus pulmonarius]KAF4590668.1 hypothetical protein EYR40_009264 [Pleurotus pulmonarius]
MPLDGHAYLVAQGWAGKGSGLREGAISRPLAIAQKKTLSGLGKDRDEAFPFWDHLFSAASTSIKIKIADSDEESDDVIVEKETTVFKRTTTGILCNRRPLLGTPATSGSTTPSSSGESSAVSNVSLLTIAKREAAKKGLYSRFFRGPVLGPEDGLTAEDEEVEVEVDVEGGGSGGVTPKPETEATGERKRKRRKKDSDRGPGSGDEGGAGEESQEGTSSYSASAVVSGAVEGQEKAERKKAKLERKQAREAKRKAKEERRKARELRKQEEERQVEETRAKKVTGKGKGKESTQQDTILSQDANGPEETGREQKIKKRKKKRDAGDDSGNITEAGGEIKSLVSPSIADLGPTASKPKKKRKRDTDE